jgi:quercetin dioxygenase-like cupin family protein
MSYPSDAEANATFRANGDVEQVTIRAARATFVAPGSVTDGQFGLFRWEMEPRAGGPAPHIHRTFSEAFYVLQGQVRLFDGNDWVDAAAGEFLFVPAHGIHAFHNASDDPAAMLILFSPAPPRETYFRALAENAAAGRTLGDEEMTAFLASHDQYMVGTPAG